MKALCEVQGVRYELFDMGALDETALRVAEAFSRYEPMSVARGVPVTEFVEFVKLLGPKAQQEELTVLARDQETGQVIGALITDDFASAPPEGMERLGENFAPIFALLGELDERYKQGRSFHPGEYLHLFMIAVDHQHQGRKVAHNLIRSCLENGIRKGYRTAVAEATGVISQHLFRNKFGFVDRFEVPYKTFVYQGRRVFDPIKEPAGTILMDKALV
jgi:ribosomal protein S18 acetylase RimI-like enzyme